MRKSIAALLAASMALTSLTPANASEWTNWNRMNPNSYKVTMAEMTNRCQVAVTLTGKGTKAECEEIAKMVLANKCQYVPVPVGVRYDWMNGLKASQPHVYEKMIQALDGPRKAYVCTSSSGRVYDWYVGEDGISCGNLGAREFVPPPVAYLPPPPPPPAVPNRPRGRGATMTTTAGANQQVTSPYIGGVILFDGGGHTTTLRNGSVSTSAAKATSTSGSGVCVSCNNSGHAPVSDTHIEGK